MITPSDKTVAAICNRCLPNHSIAAINVFLLIRNEMGFMRQKIDKLETHIKGLTLAQQELEEALMEKKNV